MDNNNNLINKKILPVNWLMQDPNSIISYNPKNPSVNISKVKYLIIK